MNNLMELNLDGFFRYNILSLVRFVRFLSYLCVFTVNGLVTYLYTPMTHVTCVMRIVR